MTFDVHAGTAYRAAIAQGLYELGATIEQPLLGLTMGRQLSWYRRHFSAAERQRHATPAQVRRALHALQERPRRIAANDWPADLQELNQPGLYSWWVDTPGAKTLTHGLGHTMKPGRIYTGQTGVTKWPSNKAGAMTLGKRIAANHLNGRIRGSTFRLTLAAILAGPERLTPAGPTGDRHPRQADRPAAATCSRLVVRVTAPPTTQARLCAQIADVRMRVVDRRLPHGRLNSTGAPALLRSRVRLLVPSPRGISAERTELVSPNT